jgi:repressor LexA
MKDLSPKQRQALEAILRCLRQRGMPPILEELAEAIGVKSRFGAFRHVRALEQKGYVRRLPGPRGIQVLKDPAGNPLPPEEQVGYLPVYDRVTAGPPDGFAVRVLTDSMAPTVAAGDIAIVRRQQVAMPGEIVVALIEDEAVLKRFERENDTVLLASDNPAYTPLRFPRGRGIQILGKVVGLLRRFNGSTTSREQFQRV